MKSYFLSPISSPDAANAALSKVLPGEKSNTWLLKDVKGDVIAYFSYVERDATTGLATIQADISGRHYDQDGEVVAVLEELRTHLGGEISNDT